MSLESQVAELVRVGAQNNLLPQQLRDAALLQIGAVSTAYQSAIAQADIQRYVDQVNGDDVANSGKTSGSPYKSLQRAITDSVPGGLVTVVVSGDYVVSDHVLITNRKVRIIAANQLGTGAKPAFTFTPYADIPTGTRCLRRFCLLGDATLNLVFLRLFVPDTTGYSALARDYRSALIGPPDGVSDSIFSRSSVGLGGCDITIPTANYGAVVAGSLFQLYVSGCTAVAAPFAGRLVDRYTNTAGTAAASVSDVFTNLATI